MAPHSSTLAWKIPWMEKLGRLQSMGSLRVGHNWATSLSLFTFMHWRRKWQPTPVFLPGESQGRERLVGCQTSMGLHRVGHDWSDLAAAAAASFCMGFHGVDNKDFAYNTGDPDLNLGFGRSPTKGNVYSLQYSYLDNAIDKGSWQAIVHGMAKSQTQLRNTPQASMCRHFCGHKLSPSLVKRKHLCFRFLNLGLELDANINRILGKGFTVKFAFEKRQRCKWYEAMSHKNTWERLLLIRKDGYKIPIAEGCLGY